MTARAGRGTLGRIVESPIMQRRQFLALSGLVALSACGGHRSRNRASTSGLHGDPVVNRPSFGDADPVSWDGRSPDAHPVHGIDVSKFQGSIDWPEARRNGVSFAFIKATEGGDRVDDLFQDHWNGAARAGVPRGAYHFFYHCRPADEQARWFIRNFPRSPGALPPVLDMEWTPFSPTCTIRPPAHEVRAEAETFLRIVGRHYGQAPILYVPVEFWNDNEMWKVRGAGDFWLRSTARHPAETYDGHHWTFWQYTGTGLVPGIGGKVDINAFHGSKGAWSDWLARRSV